MIVTGIVGGLGSQLHKYAIARTLADSLGLDLKLDIRCYYANTQENKEKRLYELDKFNIRASPANNYHIIKSRGYVEPIITRALNILNNLKFTDNLSTEKLFNKKIRSTCFYPNIITKSTSDLYELISSSRLKNLYITGEWGFSAVYLEKNRKQLINDLQPIVVLSKNANNYLNIIQNINTIACHIRRGDFINSKMQAVCNDNYYINSINHLIKNSQYSKLMIFSDDYDWAKQFAHMNFPNRSIVIEGCEAWEDFYLMSNCNNFVISNSGFSSLAAWISNKPEKKVIAPKRWVIDDNLNNIFINQLPSEWILY